MSPSPAIHHVQPREAGSTLAEVVVQLAGDWQAANEAIRAGRVQVSGNVVTDAARLLKARDVVKLHPHALAKQATAEDVRLVHVDEHLVVVAKPAVVTTMREGKGGGKDRGKGRGYRQPTLDEMVARLLAERRGGKRASGPGGRGGGAGPAGRREPVLPVHRLDRDTSGLMVFARTRDAERLLTALFKSRDIERSYLAVVHGHPEAMTITSHFVRDRGDGLRGSAEVWGLDPATGQRAVTQVQPLEAIGPYAVVRCRLETGRTHQIRIHLAELGYMLCGEKEYVRRPDGTRVRDGSGAPRQALHAEQLGFVHPFTGQPMRFRQPLPRDLDTWLDTLHRKHPRRPPSRS